MTGRQTLPSISVAIVSCRGKPAIIRAFDSIKNQTGPFRLSVLVIGDNPNWAPDELDDMRDSEIPLNVLAMTTDASWRRAPSVLRVARLRNIAIEYTEGDFICFLDDDNAWQPDHLNSLFEAIMESGAEGAYSWRRLFMRDGTPWNQPTFPWGFDEQRKSEIYNALLRDGIMDRQNNIFRDDHSYRGLHKDLALVDMGSWLFRRTLLEKLRFETTYSDFDLRNSVTEDDKLLADINASGVHVICTRRPTLAYFLGGYSNMKASEPKEA